MPELMGKSGHWNGFSGSPVRCQRFLVGVRDAVSDRRGVHYCSMNIRTAGQSECEQSEEGDESSNTMSPDSTDAPFHIRA